jgi:LuxR family maltose regulon positive regulatory protein
VEGQRAVSIQVLKTKLYVPPPRADVIPRERLLRRLDEGLALRRKLTLVAAAAGFGKTTLVSDWVARGERAVAWLSLDEADSDPVRWMAHVIAALQEIESDFGTDLLALLGSPQPPEPAALAPQLINEIAESLPPFTLVLDDYHLIQERRIHEALALLLQHMPPHMHLALTTRADPPLPLARLRVRDQITEVRAADLRFTPAEAAHFLNERMGLGLTPADVAALDARTEGWIAGLQLAALSLRDEPDTTQFIESFAGSDRYVLDYLMEEVFTRQPQAVQDFLLQTSILARLSAPLCDAVTGEENSQALLEQLEAANLFVIPLDRTRKWYRYHQLFADLLRLRLHSVMPQQVPTLHLRASRWYEEQGWQADAIQHALAAEAWPRAADLIEQAVPRLGGDEGKVFSLLEWCEQLPAEIVRARPLLNLYHAWLLADTARFDAAEAQLQQVESGAGQTIPNVAGMIAAVRSQMALSQGRSEDAVEQARRTLAQLPADSPTMWRKLAVNSLIYGSLLLGDVRAAEQALEHLPALGPQPSVSELLANALAGFLLAMQGKFHAAAQQFRHTLHHAALDGEGNRIHPLAGFAQVGLGQMLLAWNQVAEAAPLIESGLRLGEQSQNTTTLSQGYRTLLLLRWAQGDMAGFEDALQQMAALEEILYAFGLWMGDVVAAYRKQAEALAGKLAAVEPWLATYRQQRAATPPDYAAQQQDLAFARVLLAVGRAHQDTALLREATETLRSLISAAERGGLRNLLIHAWLYQALVRQAQDQPDEAVAALAKSVELAAPAGIVRRFLDEGEPVRQLLHELAQQPDAHVHVRTLLAAFQEPSESPAPAATAPAAPSTPEQANQQLIEPLTERELDVLQLMAAGSSNKEIAEQLTVTVGTVKSHAKRIYGKLAVSNRTEASARARELGLV